MRVSAWAKGTRFTIVNGVWLCRAHSGFDTRLNETQRRRVFGTVRKFLAPLAPALPSQLLTKLDAQETLDFLVTTGQLTLDEVLKACAMRNVGGALGEALRRFHSAPVAASGPAASSPIRVGDVIASSQSSSDVRWIAVEIFPTEVLWVSPQGGSPFLDRFRSSERVVGHVADMLAEGLAALSAAPPLPAGALGRDSQGNPVRAGSVLRSLADTADDPRATRLRVIGPGPVDGFVAVSQLNGHNVPFDAVTLLPGPGNVWVCEPDAIVVTESFRRGGAPQTAATEPVRPTDNVDPFSLD
jgi:hypothetical protein